MLTDRRQTTGGLMLNIDPDVDAPRCGGIYPVNINVKVAPDPFELSKACNSVLDYIGGPKGDKDVDAYFLCTGSTQPPGTGKRATKFIFNIAAGDLVSSPIPIKGSRYSLIPTGTDLVALG
jgi:hypothetical protein